MLDTVHLSPKAAMTPNISIASNIRKSAYYDATLRDGVRSFSVYNHMLIPGHFGDPEAEYDRLLGGVAQWDVAAQRQVQLKGRDAGKLAQYLTPRDLSETRVGQGRYVPLCDHDGWLINDPVLQKLSDDTYWLSIADSDIHLWAAAIGRERGWDVEVSEPDVSPMAVQGPKSIHVIESVFGPPAHELKYFGFVETDLDGIPLVLARSGWSKQGGFELYLRDGSRGTELWDKVKTAGAPFGIGPGAPNDIERLESGLISYGADIRWQDNPATPFEMGLEAMVNLGSDHNFVGRAVLERLAQSTPTRRWMGVILEGRPVFPGHPLPLLKGVEKIGSLSEFAYSKRLGKTIGVALVASDEASIGSPCAVDLPDGACAAYLAHVPFL